VIDLDDVRQAELDDELAALEGHDPAPWPEPSDSTVRGYYLPETTAAGTLYGSCMVCGMTIAHEHERHQLDSQEEHDAARLPHECCDDCWNWFADIVCELDPRLQRTP